MLLFFLLLRKLKLKQNNNNDNMSSLRALIAATMVPENVGGITYVNDRSNTATTTSSGATIIRPCPDVIISPISMIPQSLDPVDDDDDSSEDEAEVINKVTITPQGSDQGMICKPAAPPPFVVTGDDLSKSVSKLSEKIKAPKREKSLFDISNTALSRIEKALDCFLEYGTYSSITTGQAEDVFNNYGDFKPIIMNVDGLSDQDLLGLKSLLIAHGYTSLTLWDHMNDMIKVHEQFNWPMDGRIDFTTQLPLRQERWQKFAWVIAYNNQDVWANVRIRKGQGVIPLAAEYYGKLNNKHADYIKLQDDLSKVRFNNCLDQVNEQLESYANTVASDYQSHRHFSTYSTSNKFVIKIVDQFMSPESVRDVEWMKWMSREFAQQGVYCDASLKRSYYIKNASEPKRFEITLHEIPIWNYPFPPGTKIVNGSDVRKDIRNAFGVVDGNDKDAAVVVSSLADDDAVEQKHVVIDDNDINTDDCNRKL